jgi:RNA polymerase sigma-70 factor (ECF subfamily)
MMTMTREERERLFTELFNAHHTQVLAYCRRRLAADVAEDAVADTFSAAWTNLDHLRNDPLIWLFSLARGAVSHQRRRLARIARLNERSASLEPAVATPDHAESVAWQEAFDAAFEQLSETAREVLRVSVWEGLSASEGASVLGCSTTAFKVRLHRARRRLRQLLDADAPSQVAIHNNTSAINRTTEPPHTRAFARPSLVELAIPLPKEST